MSFEIRPFVPSDLAATAELYTRTFNTEPWNDQWTPERAREYLEETIERRGFLGYVAEDAGKLAGMVLGHRVSWWNGNQFVIQEMCVEAGNRRRGLGSELLRFLKKELDRKGYMQINLLTSSSHWPLGFYKKNGFVEEADLRFYYYLYKARGQVRSSEH